MDKPLRPLYTADGAVFFTGPWAKAKYNADGTVSLHAASDITDVTLLTAADARTFKQVIGDKRARA
ncbi:hypothetical protein [Deinococcus kurensis]|uniref:hypothetical protein n=1 Tax=Deinococcus kurensis TaxID=2662757 RepID=UPI0012D2C78A|nr:hypothetical protein [Deinococcus kurensis]